MWQGINVVVVDDNAQRRHDFRVILDFLGENPATYACQEWSELIASPDARSGTEGIKAVILGEDGDRPVARRLAEVFKWDDTVPMLLLGQISSEGVEDDDLRLRAIAHLEFPPSYNKLLDSLHRAQVFREQFSINAGRTRQRDLQLFRSLVGTSRQVQKVREMMAQVADKDVTVLITGESGTGKELIARALHQHGSRAQGPFIAVNAAAIPKDLLEAELFGHERGAFTGALQQRRGRFEEARGGTLFLDEIGDMPFDLQTRLLRVLADGSFYRVGGSQAVQADVRIIAATHQPLEQRVAQGLFREDLFHRLNVIRLRLPPLRERKEDIPALVNLFLRNSAQELGVAPREPTPAAMAALVAFDYPGNIRQLENFCQWLTVMSSSRWVEVKDLPPELMSDAEAAAQPLPATTSTIQTARPGSVQGPAPGEYAVEQSGQPIESGGAGPQWGELLARDTLDRLSRNEPAIMATLSRHFERVLISAALQHSKGRRIEAAQRLGIGRNTLSRKCAELGLDESGAKE